jgi:5'-methylthioadenosine phosphorylase
MCGLTATRETRGAQGTGDFVTKAIVGIIGGSGVYDLPGLEDIREEWVPTPWGKPSDQLRFGRIGKTGAVFLPRHGRGHTLSPSGINYRANIDALKRAGVTDIVSVSACGSFKPELYPRLFVLVDQFVDRTFARANSFFGNGCVAHVSMAHPVAPLLREKIAAAAAVENIACVNGGTYVCIEGPQFSSLAESLTYKAAGCDVIGMTAMPEAKLAREAEISYATIAMVTDFDCWHPKHENVDVAAVIRVVQANAGSAAKLLTRLLRDFPAEHEPCPAGSDRALDHALLTPAASRDKDLMKKLEAIMQRVNS